MTNREYMQYCTNEQKMIIRATKFLQLSFELYQKWLSEQYNGEFDSPKQGGVI